MNEYNIAKAFEAIENELTKSMIRNLERHKAEEAKEGIRWSQWQAEQLKALERYKIKNRKKFGDEFARLNRYMTELIRQAKIKGGMEQEKAILQAIKKGFKTSGKNMSGVAGGTAEFFKLNEKKLEALLKATTSDMKKAETAILRMAGDQYRKVIFNAQVYANTGAGTYEKAVDMATKDFLAAGLTCIEYKNGARHTLADYADMALRTASKRAYLQGEGEKRQEWGISLVIVNKRGNPCPKCLPYVGKIMIDDVWGGGKKSDGPYPLISTAIANGLYHPRCKDSHTTYFEGVTTAESKWTKEELKEIEQKNLVEAQQQYAARQAKKFDRLTENSLAEENKKQYQRKADEWRNKAQKEYRYLTEDEYVQFVEDGQNVITPEEKEHIDGFDWENFRPANMDYGYINTENSFLINRAIREGKVSELPTESKKTIKHLKNVIGRSRININVKGRRFVDKDWLVSKFEENADFDSIIANKRVITDKQFVSCSLTDEVSFNTRDVEIVFDIPEGTNIYVSDNRMESEAIMYNPSYFIKGYHKKMVDDGRGGIKEQIQLICEVVKNG